LIPDLTLTKIELLFSFSCQSSNDSSHLNAGLRPSSRNNVARSSSSTSHSSSVPIIPPPKSYSR